VINVDNTKDIIIEKLDRRLDEFKKNLECLYDVYKNYQFENDSTAIEISSDVMKEIIDIMQSMEKISDILNREEYTEENKHFWKNVNEWTMLKPTCCENYLSHFTDFVMMIEKCNMNSLDDLEIKIEKSEEEKLLGKNEIYLLKFIIEKRRTGYQKPKPNIFKRILNCICMNIIAIL
jgi:hypothetical protein